MFALLLVYAIFQSSFSGAVPTPSIDGRGPLSSDHPNTIQTRSLWDIIWSCLSTIFICTWVSLHPNISWTPEKPNLGWFKKWIWNPLAEYLTYRLPLFLRALLVPEYILAWAIRQYIMAGKAQKRVPGWTRTHGLFLIMGGFQLFEHPDQPIDGPSNHATRGLGKFVRILEFKDILQHELEAIIPFTTEEEIKDKGKSDGISKVIVILQISWFILQCIARSINHLPLTELEIVTLAYAMLNFFVYVFLWNKPRDVGCPIRVYANLTESRTVALWSPGARGISEKIFIYALGLPDQNCRLSQERKVPMFWSGGIEDRDSAIVDCMRATFGPSILGIAFGAIHCIAWSYVFPSHTEFVVWRTSSIAMVSIPFISTIVCPILPALDPHPRLYLLAIPSAVLVVLICWLYIAARTMTIVMAFTTLRSLPPEAFTVVNRTTFIPHF